MASTRPRSCRHATRMPRRAADLLATVSGMHSMPEGEQSISRAKGGLMAGKRGLVMGVANDRSLAWGIAAACAAQGAELAFTYQGEALEKRVRPLAEQVNSDRLFSCDVAD